MRSQFHTEYAIRIHREMVARSLVQQQRSPVRRPRERRIGRRVQIAIWLPLPGRIKT
jgi:hypothetical protein